MLESHSCLVHGNSSLRSHHRRGNTNKKKKKPKPKNQSDKRGNEKEKSSQRSGYKQTSGANREIRREREKAHQGA
jgi:hypothetical protein